MTHTHFIRSGGALLAWAAVFAIAPAAPLRADPPPAPPAPAAPPVARTGASGDLEAQLEAARGRLEQAANDVAQLSAQLGTLSVDQLTPFEPARAYWEMVRSEGKAFVAIDGGHYACFTDSDQFLAAMRNHVMPLVRQ